MPLSDSLETTAHSQPGGARIRVMAPPELPRQLVADYLARCRERAQALRGAAERRDYTAVAVWGHRMKGTGCSYGFPDVSADGAAIEQAAKRQDAAELEAALARLAAYLEAVELVEP